MRKINRAVKIRIYPNKEQITQIEKTIGCSRFLYNRMLADKIRYYQEDKKMLKNTPAGYKKDYPWLKEVDSLALANVQLNLEGAFRKFFREPGVGFPHYKSKKTFWSFGSYMVRSCKGIEMLVNLINISYCAMKLLLYQDSCKLVILYRI